MKLKTTTIIPVGAVAYHISNGKIDDCLCMGNTLGGYLGKPVQNLVNDGWSFVCAKKEFKKGDKCNYKPDETKLPAPSSLSVPKMEMTGVPGLDKFHCPYCNHELHATITMMAQLKLS